MVCVSCRFGKGAMRVWAEPGGYWVCWLSERRRDLFRWPMAGLYGIAAALAIGVGQQRGLLR